MSWRSTSDERNTMTAGCLLGLASAAVTCVMLFVNGSLVMAVLSAFAEAGPSWASEPAFSQFTLFLVPVLLVVVEWMMIDYVRTRFKSKHPVEES
jgi:uncharacterized membrane protein YhdT